MLDKNYLGSLNGSREWLRAPVSKFWGEIASADHAVQIYEDDEVLINSVAGFVGDGINCGDTSIVVATPYHIVKLEEKLKQHGINVDALISQNRYVPVDAEEALESFMIDDWPDSPLFFLTVSELLNPLKAEGRPIRAFGEMVALLWARGQKGATIQLEYLWNQYFETETFPMFCAYPRDAFTDDPHNSLSGICCAHSKIISGAKGHMTEVVYRNVDRKRPESNVTILSR